ncbi:putative reverse transcriptase domain-containing protein [Tanacetum coccineum]
MRQRRWIELFCDYDCEIRYHPGKANVVADALSRKEKVKPKRVRAMNMTFQSSIKDRILAAQKAACDESAGLQKGLDKMDRLARLYLNEIAARHGVPISIIFDCDSRFTSRFWQSMQEALETRLDMSTAYHPQTDVEFSYINSYHSSVRCALFEALYGRKCRSQIMWAEVGKGQLIGTERRKPLEFSIGDYVLLKVSPWKGVVRFEKKRKLAPRFVGPFEIIKKVGPMAYRLDLHEELDGVHDTFHMSNLKKCLADPTLCGMSFGVVNLRALVHAGDKTSGDARSWYMISGDAKSWVRDCSAYIHSSRDKEVNQGARDSDDALVCCVKNTVEDRIMDFGASFHATYCKEELERFKLRSGKVRLADDKTLDIAGVRDVVLKTSFGTSWTLKDVRYISGLNRRLISVGQLDKEGYHVGFRDQQWKITKGSLVVARRNKRGSLIGMSMLASKGNVLDVRKVDIYFCKPGGLGKQKNLSFIMSEKTMKLHSRSCGRAESMWLRAEAPKILWADSVFGCDSFVKVKDVYGESMKCTFIGNCSDEMRYSFRDTKSHQVIRSRDITFVDSIYGASQYKRVNGLSLEITQSPGGSSDTSEGSENSGSFEDSGRSDEKYSEDRASCKEGGSETP